MEKRKDIDMLRFYGGDIHQKNKEREYVITNNLVNPKNKEEMLWGDRDAYRTLNALSDIFCVYSGSRKIIGNFIMPDGRRIHVRNTF